MGSRGCEKQKGKAAILEFRLGGPLTGRYFLTDKGLIREISPR
jgi:hypothetical protein